MTKFNKLFWEGLIMSLMALLSTCTQDYFIPKPVGYPRIHFESHQYRWIDTSGTYPYNFLLSQYTTIQPDTSYIAQEYWIHISYPDYQATIDVSYKNINNNKDSLRGFFETSLRLTHKHHIRASSIDEYTTVTQNGYAAVIHELKGSIPSPMQYVVTDTTRHFLRAVLYFPYSDKNDSIAPIIDYIKKDMLTMLHSTKWQ